jgi:hypothetical protein
MELLDPERMICSGVMAASARRALGRTRAASAQDRLGVLKAWERLHPRPPIGEAVDAERGVFVGRHGDIEHNGREKEIGEA